MRIKVPSVAENKELDALPDLRVRSSQLNEAMERQAGLYAYWASLADSALQDQKDVKYRIYCLQEDLDGKLRKQHEKSGTKYTESSLKAEINRDPEFRKLQERYRRRCRVTGQLKVFVESFKQKKDMLQSLGAMTRAEREGEIRTYESKVKGKIAQAKNNKGD